MLWYLAMGVGVVEQLSCCIAGSAKFVDLFTVREKEGQSVLFSVETAFQHQSI